MPSSTKICLICKTSFVPNKYRPNRQMVCSKPECQHRRQLENLKLWREKNPDYFKFTEHELSWRVLSRQRSQAWKQHHKRKVKLYRKQKKEYIRNYMREYMRRRLKLNVAAKEARE